MLPVLQLRRVLPTLPRVPLGGPWYRAVNYDHLSGPPPGAAAGSPAQPLWPGGAARLGARFTPRATPAGPHKRAAGAIDSLYLTEDELTPLMEVTGVLRPTGSAVKLVFEPQVMLTVDGVLTDVLDLTDAANQAALGTSPQQLTGHWTVQQSMYFAGTGPMPATQVLGREAFGVPDIIGLRFPSSKNPQGFGLVVFTSKFVRGRHSLTVFNRGTGKLQQSLP
jgi:hypothetical protein